MSAPVLPTPDSPVPGSPGFQLVFAACVVATGLLVVGMIGRRMGWRSGGKFAALAAVWLAGTGALAASGVLVHFELPPRVVALFAIGFLLIGIGTFGRFGRGLTELSWGWLIGLQSFRIVVELLIHEAVTTGVAPGQLTWTGLNLDIITGVTAPVVAWLAVRGKISSAALWAWNLLGLGLVTTVVVVALLSVPTPLQQISPMNTWVVFFPYIWLPVGFVALAYWLHALSFRKLRLQSRLAD